MHAQSATTMDSCAAPVFFLQVIGRPRTNTGRMKETGPRAGASHFPSLHIPELPDPRGSRQSVEPLPGWVRATAFLLARFRALRLTLYESRPLLHRRPL